VVCCAPSGTKLDSKKRDFFAYPANSLVTTRVTTQIKIKCRKTSFSEKLGRAPPVCGGNPLIILIQIHEPGFGPLVRLVNKLLGIYSVKQTKRMPPKVFKFALIATTGESFYIQDLHSSSKNVTF
jgi:hypothetical protein